MSLTLMLTYPFMQRALIAGTLVSLCAALLGVCLLYTSPSPRDTR